MKEYKSKSRTWRNPGSFYMARESLSNHALITSEMKYKSAMRTAREGYKRRK
jgi:hypothetical protein